MATHQPVQCKRCFECTEVTLHDMDGHFKCLRCLTVTHDPFDCDLCEALPKPVKHLRLALIAETLQGGNWPGNWLRRLNQEQDMVFASPDNIKSPKGAKQKQHQKQCLKLRKRW